MKTFAIALACASVAAAQQAPAPDWKTLGGTAKTMYTAVKTNIVKSAERMPDDGYSFKATPEVRSFAQLIGHLADANNTFCSGSLGLQNPNPGIEKSKSSKADLVAALKAAMELCDKAYDVTEAQAAEMIKFRNAERTRFSMLVYNAFHSNLHYGNVVTYLRLKKITPPSTEP
jgi:uncharacterized damage-inducible protein DinB